ncbi:MAG: catalase/peroxidase HPI [Rhodobacteraceae bacterium]|nr:MAG: catalase/peroxidase HPI [Paracoccaceae bacterium]
MNKESKCPVVGNSGNQIAVALLANHHWWPNQLNLKVLNQNALAANPLPDDFNYSREFESLDLELVKKDLFELMTNSQEWWPADYGHYGPFFIRMAWHSAGTYRIGDGRGGAGAGTLRFAPLNSWPDNGNLDKARRLLWPIKQKYGQKISWADLMILTGNCALESMGFKTFGFAGGREDVWEPEEEIYWGSESEWLADERYTGVRELEKPLGAVQMGLIYVNPEGPNGHPDPLASAVDIRETFGRMAMNDEETVALIAGGHTFGKGHGAADPDVYVGPEPEGAPIEAQGTGWQNAFGSGKGADTITSGLEGAWTANPVAWDNNYFENLFGYEWEQTKSPAGAIQWVPKDAEAVDLVPDAHDKDKRHAPIMFTTDLALKLDPIYGPISKRFFENPDQFAESFSKAWFKLTHRDLGPFVRGLGALVPDEPQVWQDPVPEVDHKVIGSSQIKELKTIILSADLTIPQLVKTAWASASTFRGTDKRGGANGARIRLEPQKSWAVNEPVELSIVLEKLKKITQDFNKAQTNQMKVSLADLIVLGGCAAVEEAARLAGFTAHVNFTPGRTDASQELTDIDSFSVLEPLSCGFKNHIEHKNTGSLPEQLVERARLLTLTAPEMTVLLGGLRVLNSNSNGSQLGVFTNRPGHLTNDFFVELLDINTSWTPSQTEEHVFEGRENNDDSVKWKASSFDLIFGSNSQLRGIAEVFATDNSGQAFVDAFCKAWVKVMELDRFDLVK